MECCSANGLVTTIFWICWQRFLSSLAPFKAKLWHKGKLRRGKPVKSVKWFKQQFRRFFFDFTNVSLITLGWNSTFRSKNPILLEPPKSHFSLWILILVEDGSIKRWKYSNSSHKKAEFYSLQNRESQGPFLKDHTAAAQQRSILWCNRGAVVNFWRLFLGLKKKDPKLAMPKWPEVTICRFVMPPQNISAKWNGGFFGAIIPRKYGSVRTKLLPIIIKRLDL